MQASNQTGVPILASSRTGVPLPWGSSQTGALDLWVHPWHLYPLQHLWGLSHHHASLDLKALGGELGSGACTQRSDFTAADAAINVAGR